MDVGSHRGGELYGDGDVFASPDAVFGRDRGDRRGVGRVGGPGHAALHDGDVGVGDHPQRGADGEGWRQAEAAGDCDVRCCAEPSGDVLDVYLQLLPGRRRFGPPFGVGIGPVEPVHPVDGVRGLSCETVRGEGGDRHDSEGRAGAKCPVADSVLDARTSSGTAFGRILCRVSLAS